MNPTHLPPAIIRGANLAPRSAGAVTRGRLTDVERAERSVKEADLQRQVTDLAGVLGWSWVHFRAGLRANGRWQIAVEGPLGKGWPDLVLVRERDRRLIFAELKRELEQPSADQDRVLEALGVLEFGRVVCGEGPHPIDATTGLETRHACCWPWIQRFVWRPSDLRDPIESSRIYEVLR